MLESYINDVKADTRAAAVRLQEQDAKINALQKQLRYQTIVAAAREKELEKEVATLRDIVTKESSDRKRKMMRTH